MRGKRSHCSATKTYKKKYVLPRSRKNAEASNDTAKSNDSEGKSISEEKTKSIDVEEFEKQKQEIFRLWRLTQMMQTQRNRVINLAREGKIDAFDDSFRTTVIAVTKRVIYPLC